MASESVTFLLSTMFDQLELEGTENKLSTMVLMRLYIFQTCHHDINISLKGYHFQKTFWGQEVLKPVQIFLQFSSNFPGSFQTSVGASNMPNCAVIEREGEGVPTLETSLTYLRCSNFQIFYSRSFFHHCLFLLQERPRPLRTLFLP